MQSDRLLRFNFTTRFYIPSRNANCNLDRYDALGAVEQSVAADTWPLKESRMPTDPKKQEPDIPAQKPDILPEPRPEEIPQQDVPEKEAPPTMRG